MLIIRRLWLSKQRTIIATSSCKKLKDLTRIAFSYQPSTGNYDHPSLQINSMISICNFCKAKKIEGESQGICCSGGKVILELFPALPPLLQELLSGEVHKQAFPG